MPKYFLYLKITIKMYEEVSIIFSRILSEKKTVI